jgi:hypothetical protein
VKCERVVETKSIMIVVESLMTSLYRVVLKYKFGLSRSVFIRASSRSEAERRALRRYRDAVGIDRTMYPLN